MNRSIYLQILVFAILVALMGSLNTYAQEASAGPIPEIYLNKHFSKTPDQNTLGDNPLATLAYGYGGQLLQTISMPLPAGQPFTNLAAFTFPSFASSMTRGGDGNYYITTVYQTTPTVEQPKLYQLNTTTGVPALLGDITGMGTNSPNGISYNPNNSTYYIMASTTPTNSLLYSFNVTTRVATLIGTVGTGALMIDLCFDFSGTCYTYDLITDNAYTVNINTGAATLLGPLGFSANFGQGMGYDFENGWIYLSAFRNLPSNDGQLRVMDPQTGYTNLLASYGVNQVAPFAPASTIIALPGPGRATNPTPVNGATGVPTASVMNTNISWTNAGGATSVEVFFGTNPLALPSIYSGAAVTSRSVVTAYSTTYYWYVNETSGGNTTKGTLWSFTTGTAPCPVSSLPVVEDFELGVFPPLCWSQTGAIWTNDNTVSGYGNGTWSAVADFYNVGTGSDDLISIEYNSTGAVAPLLKFDWAYATYIDDADEMDIYYSTNAGATWTILLAMPGGLNGILNPFHLATTDPYFPADNEWSTMSLALPAGTNKVKFTAVTAFGNLCWLDNISISGQTFFDNMEAYTAGQQLACQNPTNWTTWSLAPCSAVEDPYISSTYAYSGTKSCKIVQNNDLVKLFGTKTSGKWYVNFRFYIPAGKSGYVNLLSDFVSTVYEWGLDCYFYADGTGELELDLLGSYLFPYQQGNWNNALFIVDLNTSTAEFWVGPGTMSQIATWDWTQAGAVLNQLDAADIFGAAPTDEMYFDNFYFSDIAPPIPQMSNNVGTESIDLAYQYGPGTVVPQATVKNYGIATNTFNVTMTITGGYTSTKTVTALAPGATQQVTFDNYTAATGAYVVNVCTQLTGDEDPLNDCRNQSLYVWDPSGTWSTGLDYPITAYNGTGVTYNDGTTNWLFVMGGNTPSTLGTECYKYNFTANTWTQIASLPVKRIIAAGAVVGNFIYVMGGSDGTVYTNTTYKYDIAGNTWSTVAPLPGTIGWGRAVAYNNNYIYLAGGVSAATGGIYLNTVYLYDVTANTWSLTTNPMPLAVFGGGFALTGDKLVYAAGAYEAGILNTVMVGTITANPAVINWAVMDNPYPGINNQDCSKYGVDFTQEMLTQSIGGINPLSDVIPFPGGALYQNTCFSMGR